MDFNKFIGNDSIKAQIQSLIKHKKISHAIMIDGAKGVGKRTFANIIAQACVCSNITNGSPCTICSNCKKAEKGIHPDIIYPEKSGVLQGYSISTVRAIREDAYIVPNEAAKKVYIFTDIDNMGVPAQNALLKILEEPPRNVIFIFTCISFASVLATIRSRVQLFSLKPVSTNEVLEYLNRNYPDREPEILKKISDISNGNIGLAIDLLTSSDFEEIFSITEKLAESIISPREFDLLSLVPQISDNRKTFSSVLMFLKSILRDALILSNQVQVNRSTNKSTTILSQNLSIKQILELIDIIENTKTYLDKNVNLSILTSYFCSNLHRIAFIDL